MIPATPLSGTADPNPLVRLSDYQFVTGDTTSDSTAFAMALLDALDLFQRRTNRTLLYAQYAERLFLYKNGMVYPSATPLDASKSVMSPQGDPPSDVGVFQGNGIWVGWYVPLPSLPVWEGVVDPQTNITYWGGYVGPQSSLWVPGGGQFNLPASIKRILAKMCWFLLHPVTLPGLPGGVKSTSVAGVSVSGDLESMVDGDRELCHAIKRWRHPQAKPWDAQVTPGSP